jgi:hypothetical protein
MRTTVTLAPEAHAAIREISERERRSLSAVIADLVDEGLSRRAAPPPVYTSPVTGLPVFHLPGRVTPAEAAELIAEDR